MRIAIRLIFIFLMPSLFLLSCAGTISMTEPTKAKIIENVPFHPQEMFQCGPASLSEIFQFWGVKVSPEEIAGEIFSPSAQGTLTMDMVLYSQRKGFTARFYKGGFEDLRENVDRRYPLIVLVDYGFSLYQKSHFMVLLGYTEEGVIAHSGKEPNKFIPKKDFLRSWERTEFWTLLILPKGYAN